MRLLLDTHALIWWFSGDRRISARAFEQIDKGSVAHVSAASIYEIRLKHRLGKLEIVDGVVSDLEGASSREGFIGLPISLAHADLAAALPLHHRDPFDRMLIAQALADGLTLVSNERLFDAYGVKRLW